MKSVKTGWIYEGSFERSHIHIFMLFHCQNNLYMYLIFLVPGALSVAAEFWFPRRPKVIASCSIGRNRRLKLSCRQPCGTVHHTFIHYLSDVFKSAFVPISAAGIWKRLQISKLSARSRIKTSTVRSYLILPYPILYIVSLTPCDDVS